MEFGMLLKLVDLMNVMHILRGPIDIQCASFISEFFFHPFKRQVTSLSWARS